MRVSDIDLVVAHPGFTESKKLRLLSELAQAMRNSSITEKVAVIAKAKVPIVKFVTTRGKSGPSIVADGG